MSQSGNESAAAVRTAALASFSELGYHGTSVREIARRSRLSVAALYHHFPSKELLLTELINHYMDDLLEAIGTAAEETTDLATKLLNVVKAHVQFHLERREEGRVGNAELSRLGPDARTEVLRKRSAERQLFQEIVDQGVDQKVFAVAHRREAVRAILEMSTAVLDLYDEADRRDPARLANSYGRLALNVVGYAGTPDPARR